MTEEQRKAVLATLVSQIDVLKRTHLSQFKAGKEYEANQTTILLDGLIQVRDMVMDLTIVEEVEDL